MTSVHCDGKLNRKPGNTFKGDIRIAVDESKNGSEEQEELAVAAADIDAAAMDLAEQGIMDMAEGSDDLDFADDLAATAAAEAMAGASDLTRAVDAEIVADRLATLSGVVAAAGVNDIGQGAELIMTSADVEAMSATVGLMTLDDLDKGLELGRLAGELQTLGNVVSELEMPVLSAVLGDRGLRLLEIATDTILRAAATRSLAELMMPQASALARWAPRKLTRAFCVWQRPTSPPSAPPNLAPPVSL